MPETPGATPERTAEPRSAKMLIFLQNGEQRLVTFTLPKKSCALQEVFKECNIPFTEDTYIQCMQNTNSEIDYFVSVGCTTRIEELLENHPMFIGDRSSRSSPSMSQHHGSDMAMPEESQSAENSHASPAPPPGARDCCGRAPAGAARCRCQSESAQPVTAARAAGGRSRCRVVVRGGGGGRAGGGGWRAHEFEVWGGERAVCRAAALRMRDSLLLWVGAAGAGRAALGEAALALPAAGACTALLAGAGGAGGAGAGGEGAAPALARRLAAALRKPVLVFCGAAFDRFALPLVERGLVAEIKNRPECF